MGRKQHSREAAGGERAGAIQSAQRHYDRLLRKHLKWTEAGDRRFILHGLHQCLATGRPVPLPLAQAFCDCFDDFASYRAETLDEAFGVERPARQHFDSLRARSWLMPLIVLRVDELHRQGRAIDGSLFADVAREFKSSERTVNGLYYDPAMRWLRRLAKKKPLRRRAKKHPRF